MSHCLDGKGKHMHSKRVQLYYMFGFFFTYFIYFFLKSSILLSASLFHLCWLCWVLFCLLPVLLRKKNKTDPSHHNMASVSHQDGFLCETKMHWSRSPFYQLHQENIVGAPPFRKQRVKWQALCFVLFFREGTSLKRHHESCCLPLTPRLVFLWQLDEKRQDRDSATTCYPHT